MKPPIKIAIDFHRNGICGAPFHVILFEDTGEEGSRKVAIVFDGPRHIAVLDVEKLAAGNIAFGSNSRRGDQYEAAMRQAGDCQSQPRIQRPTPTERKLTMYPTLNTQTNYGSTNSSRNINPFYADRMVRDTAPIAPSYARLPLAPRNASPVPHLTSLYHFHRAGEYGDRKYRGNCGGNLIKDLLTFFAPTLVMDPMSGSGTCLDVCEELRIPCMSSDIHQGFDACDPEGFGSGETFDFIWAHPLCGAPHKGCYVAKLVMWPNSFIRRYHCIWHVLCAT